MCAPGLGRRLASPYDTLFRLKIYTALLTSEARQTHGRRTADAQTPWAARQTLKGRVKIGTSLFNSVVGQRVA